MDLAFRLQARMWVLISEVCDLYGRILHTAGCAAVRDVYHED